MTVRERRADDLPLLEALLAEQRPVSGYPRRWPVPADRFLRRRGELQAWVAEREGRVVGHAAVQTPGTSLVPAFVEALGAGRLGEVVALFVASGTVGTGVGGRLLDTAVDWIRQDDRVPVLALFGHGSTAEAVYRHRGWVELGAVRPDWVAAHEPDIVLMALPGT